MEQKDTAIIVTEQLTTHLAVPSMIINSEGKLIFYNEPAEVILGYRFADIGEMPLEKWANMILLIDEKDTLLTSEAVPLTCVLMERRPFFRSSRLRTLTRLLPRTDIIAFPLVGQGEKYLGTVILLWIIIDVNKTI